jgi:hypothetical protein
MNRSTRTNIAIILSVAILFTVIVIILGVGWDWVPRY